MENKLIFSAVLIVSMLLLRWVILHSILKLRVEDISTPRRWKNAINNTSSLLIIVGLFIIWLSELRFVALSVATFAVALVIACREFIQCFLGAVYLASSRPFSVGDWIRINNQCGEVVSSDWLNTQLLEVDIENSSYCYTGRTLVIPNNQFVAGCIQNMNFMRRYIPHSFSIVRESDDIDLFQFKKSMLNKTLHCCAPFHEVAQRYNSLLEKRLGIIMAENQISVRVSTTNLGKNMMTITYFCPTDQAIDIEQTLTKYFMDLWYAASKEIKKKKEASKLCIHNNTDSLKEKQ